MWIDVVVMIAAIGCSAPSGIKGFMRRALD